MSNNGANYVAAGGFNGTYNFGTRAFTISNFDGNTLTATGTVPANSASYTFNGTVPRTGMTGTLNGTFYGPMAAETGGNFTLQIDPRTAVHGLRDLRWKEIVAAISGWDAALALVDFTEC